MDISTTYLGLKLRSPLVVSASPLSKDLDGIRKMEDSGAGAVVLPSVFEEQIRRESEELNYHLEHGTESFAEALSYFPQVGEFRLGPEDYLELVSSARKATEIPIIASLNGTSVGGWTDYAKKIEAAGASALELNIYYIPTDPDLSSVAVENTYLDILKGVKAAVKIPVSVKLSPFFSNFAYVAKQMDAAGADGLVLFNRFYQPDIDIETMEVEHSLLLSTPQARRLPLRWVAILHGRLRASLAATSGLHTPADVLKVVMAGADVAMLCSVLLRRGISHLAEIEKGLVQWMEEHEYDSITQMKGCLSQKNSPDPSAFERAQYMRLISTYQPV